MGYGHVERLRRATEHMEAIEAMTSEWMKDKRITHDLDPQTNERVIRLFVPEAPPELDARVSECLHSARSALDNLVFALSSRFSKEAFTPQRQATSEFPIFWDRPPKPAELQRRIGCIDPDARRIIEVLQPHQAPDHHWLYLLHHLSRIDKHRFGCGAALVNTGFGMSHVADLVYIETLTMNIRMTGAPGSQTELGRYRGWHEIAGNRYTWVPISINTEAVFLDDGAEGRPVAATIRQILQHIELHIVQPLRQYL